MKPLAEGQMIGHAQLMFDRLQRLHDSMRARGASEAAIARLPKLPIYDEPLELKPVLAGRRHASRAHPPKIKRERARRQSARPARNGLATGRTHLEADDGALKRRVIAIVAEAAGIPEHALATNARSFAVVPARHIAWRLMRELSGLSTVAIAALFDQGHHTSILYGLAKVRDHIAAGKRWSQVYWASRAKLLDAGAQKEA